MRNDAGHTSKAFEVHGEWARWSQYELVNATVVPAKGAELLRYDPWQGFRTNVGLYRTVEQPYVAFLELNRKLKALANTGVRPFRADSRHAGEHTSLNGPQNEADQVVLDWCNQHGLVGLVPVLCNSIRLPPQIEKDERGGCVKITHAHHFRDGGIWHSLVQEGEIVCCGEDCDTTARKAVASDPKPTVTWFDWMSHLYEEKPLDYFRQFFPGPQHNEWVESFAPPKPITANFWKAYCEPTRDLCRWCENFALSVDYLSGWGGGRGSDSEQGKAEQAHWFLVGLSQSAAPTFRFHAGRNSIDEVRVSAGLLSSYALMFLWDRMDSRRALRCGVCDRYFVTDEQRAEYCSPRCRNTAQKRRFRARRSNTGE